MWLSGRLSLPISKIVATVSDREIRLQEAYFRDRFNRLEKSDYYLMQIAQVIRDSLSSKRKGTKVEDYVLAWRRPMEDTPENRKAVSDKFRRWLGGIANGHKGEI